MVLSNKIFSPQNFIEICTGVVYTFTDEEKKDIIKTIHNILRKHKLEDDHLETLWDYPLSEIDVIEDSGSIVVLVDVSHYEDDKYINEYRWFEVPDTVAKPDEFEYYDDIVIV